MQMTEAEIVKSYQRADKKREQIKILAELNACQKQVIRDILEKNGEEVPKTGNRYTVKKPEVTEANGSKRKQETTDCKDYVTTDCKDCAMEKCCGYGKEDGVQCDSFTPKGSESSKVSAPEKVGTHQQEVGTKSEKVVTLGDLIGLIDRDRENNKTISIMDENGAEQLRVLTRSPFLEDLEEYVVTDLDVGDGGWICVWLGEKKEET